MMDIAGTTRAIKGEVMATKKKVVSGEECLGSLSVADLYALYMFVGAQRNRKTDNNETKSVVDQKFFQVEAELFNRAYGHNPFKKEVVINGQKPEEVIGQIRAQEIKTFIVTTNADVSAPAAEGEEPQTFVVKKNETPVEEYKPLENVTQTFVVTKNE